MILFSSKIAISSPIQQQQFPLSQHCMKPNTKKNLTDMKKFSLVTKNMFEI